MPYVHSAGADLYFEVHGAGGPSVLMIRGFASTIRSWNGIERDLARDHRTIVFDNRGAGRSSAPKGRYSAALMAGDAAAVLDAAGVDSAHVLGTSMGGMIAQELALRHRDRVRSLVLAATSPGTDAGIGLRKRGVAAVTIACLLPPKLRARVSTLATLSREARRLRPELIRHRGDVLAQSPTPLRGIIGQAFAVFGHRAGSRLGEIAAPTLVVHGDADNLIRPANAQILADLIPRARLDLWCGVGHDLATEAPERLATAVREHVWIERTREHFRAKQPVALRACA